MLRFASRKIGPLAGAAFVLLTSCGDTAGDPIDSIRTTSDVVEVPPVTEAALGLCEACETTGNCGDGNDNCLINARTEERFCGRDCAEGGGCPVGYQCVEVRNAEYEQCVPTRATCSHRASLPAPPPVAELRATALSEINRRRAARSLPAFAQDSCLEDLAQASAAETSAVGALFGKYKRECASLYPACACSWASEQAAVVAGFGLTPEAAILGGGYVVGAIERAFSQPGLMATPEIGSDRFRRIGIGIVLSGDEATFSFTYAE